MGKIVELQTHHDIFIPVNLTSQLVAKRQTHFRLPIHFCLAAA